jgi:hypothetical protein
MSDIVPFGAAQLPAYLQNRKALASINKDVMTSAQYPTLSIKGKVFTLVMNNEKKMVMNPNDEDAPAQSVQLNVVRANTKARVYYKGSYSEGDNTPPTCASNDGIAPRADVPEPQSKKCQICPHAAWGSKIKDDGSLGEGTECAVNTRLAVQMAEDTKPEKTTFLLRVPAGSRKNYADTVKAIDARGIPYNAVVLKTTFDPTAPSPKLVFKPVGLLADDAFDKVAKLYDEDLIKAIVGLEEPVAAAPAPIPEGGVDTDELDAALAAKAAVSKAAAPVKAKPAAAAPAKVAPAAEVSMEDLDSLVDKVAPPKPAAAAAKPAAKPAPATPAPAVAAPAAPVGMDDLMSELKGLLDSPDD